MNTDSKSLKEMSNAVRVNALHGLIAADSGHLGIVLDFADVATTIYANYFNPEFDKFVLSAGHGSALLYSVLDLAGYNVPDLESFRGLGGLPGHPEYGIDGVSATTGPLGQGVGNAVGMALANKISYARGLIDAPGSIYCLCSDGDLMEGVTNESIEFAGRYNLNNLILFWDDNGISIDGTALTDVDVPMRMESAGFKIIKVKADDFNAISKAIESAKKSNRPVFIQCTAKIGAGSSVAGTPAAHGLEVKKEELIKLQKQFESKSGKKLWIQVAENLARQPRVKIYDDTEMSIPFEFGAIKNVISTRDLSGMYLEKIVKQNPMIIGGSADLSESTKTKVSGSIDITADDFKGNFIHYGVREHAMAAIMSGLSLSGYRPYGGTFLVFSDYMRPAIRLAAMMKQPVIYVFSHDSIGVGQDGPTHEPIEQLASLRLIPNLNVFRPCNMTEVATCWQIALREKLSPAAIILSRQKFTQIDTVNKDDISRGGYIIYDCKSKKLKRTIIATGSEVSIAVAVAKELGDTNVVSMPCVEIFRMQPIKYKNSVLRGHIIALEAGATSGWYEFADGVIGIDEFGVSGTSDDVYKHFGLTSEKIINEIKNKLK